MLLICDEGGRPIFGLKGGAFIGIYQKHAVWAGTER